MDEKLEATLQRRVSESFRAVSTQLEQVYKGLGEMQNLAADVGSLKQVLSGVKTRGILGEVQLGAILKEILAPANTPKMWLLCPAAATGWNMPSSCRARAEPCGCPLTPSSPAIPMHTCRTPKPAATRRGSRRPPPTGNRGAAGSQGHPR